jgi:hypothetical protein
MDRRTVLLASLAIVAASHRARAQPVAGRVFRIGFVGVADAASRASQIEALRQGLRELGYEEGRNIVIEFRWTHSDYAQLPKRRDEFGRERKSTCSFRTARRAAAPRRLPRRRSAS